MQNQLAKITSNQLIQKIGNDIKKELMQSAVKMPQNYSFENALKSAYLILLETKTKDKKPVLQVCSQESIHNALLDMAVQGLNPMKKQCSFIAYGSKLTMQREWPGSIAVAKRVDPQIIDINAQPIYEGDVVKSKIVNGIKQISHEQDFMNVVKDKIIGAYCIAIDADEKQIYTDIMTIAEIKQSWKQSKVDPVSSSGKIDPNSTHGKFTEEMARKTIYHRLCKKIINTSDDSELLKAVANSDEDRTEVDIMEDEVRTNANQKVLDFKPTKEADPPIDVTPDSNHATDDQCRKIFELEKKANRHEKILETVGGFVGRKIEGLKELTKDEADSYIAMASRELEDGQGPDWA